MHVLHLTWLEEAFVPILWRRIVDIVSNLVSFSDLRVGPYLCTYYNQRDGLTTQFDWLKERTARKRDDDLDSNNETKLIVGLNWGGQCCPTVSEKVEEAAQQCDHSQSCYVKLSLSTPRLHPCLQCNDNGMATIDENHHHHQTTGTRLSFASSFCLCNENGQSQWWWWRWWGKEERSLAIRMTKRWPKLSGEVGWTWSERVREV